MFPRRKPLCYAALGFTLTLIAAMTALMVGPEALMTLVAALPVAVGATYVKEPSTIEFVADAARATGDVIQMPDGRAGIVAGSGPDAASGDPRSVHVSGHISFTKDTSVSILDGSKCYWDRANAQVTPLKASGDFYVGVAVGDAAQSDSSLTVDLNAEPKYHIELFDPEGTWTTEQTDGLGVTEAFSSAVLEFDAVAEVAQAALFSDDNVDVDDGPILEGRLTVNDNGDNAALDMDWGLAVGSHATDFESVAQFVAFHMDGNSANILAHSDDGTTDVAPADTTVDMAGGTFQEFWIDCRDKTSCKLYIDGVRVLSGTTFDLSGHTGTLVPIVHMEKTSNDTTAKITVDSLRVRTTDRAD